MARAATRRGRTRAIVAVQLASTEAGLPSTAQLLAWAEQALADQQPHAEITIRIVDEAEGRALNRQWRQRDYATNVLSFSLRGPAEIAPDLLGDLVLCAPVIAAEAAAQGKTLHAHWAHLTIHGVLHLLGHEHQDAVAAATMEARERAILAALGWPDPYRA